MLLKEESLVALRVAHLSMIQGVITRMSGFSASAKTFTITILAGLTAISLQADSIELGVIAMIGAFTLFLLDTYYMTLEVRFRNFYDEVVARDLEQAANLIIAPSINQGDTKKAISSKSNWLFYGPVLVACVLFICYESLDDQKPERPLGSNTTHVERCAEFVSATPRKCSERSAQPAAAATPSAERSVRSESAGNATR
jgi:hypothetical protein